MGIPQFLKDFQDKENRTQYLRGVASTLAVFALFFLFGIFLYVRNILTLSQFIFLSGFVLGKFIALIHLRRQFLAWKGTIFLPILFNIFLNLIGFTGVIYFTGPYTTPLFALYLIQVMVVALYYNLGTALIVSALTALCYATMSWLVYLGTIPFSSPYLGQDILARIRPPFILEATMVLFLFSVVISFLAFYINRRLRESEKETRRLARIKDEFFTRATHDLRSPIHGILGLLELFKTGIYGTATPRQQEALDMMEKGTRSLLDLMNDILDLSRITSGKIEIQKEAVALDGVIGEVYSVALPLAQGKGLTVIRDIPDGLPLIMTDRAKLRQILLNLVGNAVKFTDTGHVAIRARGLESEISIAVEDTGIGIEKEHLETIFEEFTQAGKSLEPGRKGSGLGLSISRRLAELLGGRIQVRSSPGRGSVFTLTLPLARRSGMIS